ncbi:MAG: DUF2752 domain-containing protein [Flavobacteriales bacterium]
MARWGKVLAAAAVLSALAYLYFNDPEKGGFPSCPFHLLTGLLCPGCGSQRALHDLMHLRVGEAFDQNALLVLSIPLLLAQWAIGRWGGLSRPVVAYNAVVFGWLATVVGWGVGRNIW